MNRINVNKKNSIIVNERLFITGLKMSQLTTAVVDLHIVRGNTINHPTLGMMYEYDGNYSRK
tara:strand:+ start:113 stop:298 length:186 start_codon:yes stop_codon:yes gene_type:complete